MIKSKLELILRRWRSPIRFSLKRRIISVRVAFLPGIFTPSVAREAISIISWNLGCWSDWIGCKGYWNICIIRKHRKQYLISGNKPLQCCTTKKGIWVLDNLWSFSKMAIKTGLLLSDYSLFSFLDISRKSRLEVILWSPLTINALYLMSIIATIYMITYWVFSIIVATACGGLIHNCRA